MSEVFRVFGAIQDKTEINDLPEDQSPAQSSYVPVAKLVVGNEYQVVKVKLQNLAGGSTNYRFIEMMCPGYLAADVLFGHMRPYSNCDIVQIDASVYELPTDADLVFQLWNYTTNTSAMGSNSNITLAAGGDGFISTLLSYKIALLSNTDDYGVKIISTGTTGPGAYLTVRLTLE